MHLSNLETHTHLVTKQQTTSKVAKVFWTLYLLFRICPTCTCTQAAVHGVAKSQTRLSDFTFTFHFHALEKEMATHSTVLAWRIPGMGEPGGLPSMGRTESDMTEAT